jgi:hypothetical protein
MNDIDPEVRSHLRGLIDPEPVDTDRALQSVHASRLAHRGGAPRRHTPLVAVAVVVAVLLVTVLATTRDQQAPPYRLVGAAGANVVVQIDSSDAQAPTATLTVGDSTLAGVEFPATPTPDGLSFGAGIKFPSEPSADVPDGSSLRIEGTFDTASASALHWIALAPDGAGGVNVLEVGTWQLDSSGGSVVFTGQDGDRVHLIVQITTGGDQHYYSFPIRIVPIGS